MIDANLRDSSDFVEYLRLLVKLHALTAEGKSETEEADAVRDEMDRPWYQMSEDEIYHAGIVSADLYMLSGDEVFRQVPEHERSREWLAPQLQEAEVRQDWWRVLELLRNGPDFLAPDQVAYLRGKAYSALGHPDIALLFYEYAAGQAPRDPIYPISVRETLQQLGRKEEAIK